MTRPRRHNARATERCVFRPTPRSFVDVICVERPALPQGFAAFDKPRYCIRSGTPSRVPWGTIVLK